MGKQDHPARGEASDQFCEPLVKGGDHAAFERMAGGLFVEDVACDDLVRLLQP